MNTTDHASLRMQQRGVSGDVLAALITFGRVRRKGGVRVVYWDRGARRAISHSNGTTRIDAQMTDKLRGLYAVIGNNEHVITVAHRTKSFRFD